MARRSVAVAILVSGLLVAGCAHSAGSVSNDVADDQSSILVPPKMLPSGAPMKRDLEEYIAQLLFVPAKRDGVPVAGVFKMTFR